MGETQGDKGVNQMEYPRDQGLSLEPVQLFVKPVQRGPSPFFLLTPARHGAMF